MVQESWRTALGLLAAAVAFVRGSGGDAKIGLMGIWWILGAGLVALAVSALLDRAAVPALAGRRGRPHEARGRRRERPTDPECGR